MKIIVLFTNVLLTFKKLVVFIVLLNFPYFTNNIPLVNLNAPSNGIVKNKSMIKNGYFFSSAFLTSKSGQPPVQYLLVLNFEGEVIYYKKVNKTNDFKMHNNGVISYSSFENEQDVKYFLVDTQFNIVDSVSCKNGHLTDGHDLVILENGHFLVMGIETVQMDLSAYPVFFQSKSVGCKNATVKCGLIQELNQKKEVVFEWHSKDAFTFNDVDPFFLKDTLTVDWTHFNAVSEDAEGNIYVSVRNFNEITKINKKSGKVVWRMGGKRNQIKFLNDSIRFLGQHDCRILKSGNITLLDNGHADKATRHFVRGVEYEVKDETKTARMVWEYNRVPGIYSEGTGNLQRLEDGNTLIDFGRVMNDNVTFEIVGKNKDEIYSMKFVDTLCASRTYYYPTLPRQLNLIQVKKKKSNGNLFLEVVQNFSGYKWSTGDTTKAIKVTSTGIYNVFVPYGNVGGYMSSEYLKISDSDLTNVNLK